MKTLTPAEVEQFNRDLAASMAEADKRMRIARDSAPMGRRFWYVYFPHSGMWATFEVATLKVLCIYPHYTDVRYWANVYERAADTITLEED